jgi:hypothetical protein
MRVSYPLPDLARIVKRLDSNRTNLFAQACGTICLALSAGLAAFSCQIVS